MAATRPLLERLSPELWLRAQRAGVSLGEEASPLQTELPALLSFGVGSSTPELGLLRGQVTELCVARSGGLATNLALHACAQAQHQGQTLGGDGTHWCAFVDPSASLYAPGVVAQGVRLDRLLVVRPPVEALGRVALRLARSKVFGLLVVDTVGAPGQSIGVDLGAWVRIVRQMTIALEGSQSAVLLVTSEFGRRPIALPVARRIDVSHPKPDVLRFRIARDRFRQPEPWRNVPYMLTRFEEPIRRAG